MSTTGITSELSQVMSEGNRTIRIVHKPSGETIAEGPLGWSITAFEGNYYISSKYLKTRGFVFSGVPGICPYKFVYFWYHFKPEKGTKDSMLAWKYWLPNPLFPFIAFRIAVPATHPSLTIEVIDN